MGRTDKNHAVMVTHVYFAFMKLIWHHCTVLKYDLWYGNGVGKGPGKIELAAGVATTLLRKSCRYDTTTDAGVILAIKVAMPASSKRRHPASAQNVQSLRVH